MVKCVALYFNRRKGHSARSCSQSEPTVCRTNRKTIETPEISPFMTLLAPRSMSIDEPFTDPLAH